MQYLRNFFHVEKKCLQLSVFFSYRRVAFEKGSQFFSATIIYSSNGCQRQCRSVFSDFPSLLLSPHQPATDFFPSQMKKSLLRSEPPNKIRRYQILTIVWLRCPRLGLDPQDAEGNFFLNMQLQFENL